jgi:hypothetical protein
MTGLMRISRAAFLRTCGGLVAGRGLIPLELFAFGGTQSLSAATAAAATATEFHAHVGSTAVAIDAAGTRVPLTLASVSGVRACGRFEQFAVTFHAAADAPLTDGTHAVHHPALGEMALFIVRIGRPGGERAVYEACFSRAAGTAKGHLHV